MSNLYDTVINGRTADEFATHLAELGHAGKPMDELPPSLQIELLGHLITGAVLNKGFGLMHYIDKETGERHIGATIMDDEGAYLLMRALTVTESNNAEPIPQEHIARPN